MLTACYCSFLTQLKHHLHLLKPFRTRALTLTESLGHRHMGFATYCALDTYIAADLTEHISVRSMTRHAIQPIRQHCIGEFAMCNGQLAQ